MFWNSINLKRQIKDEFQPVVGRWIGIPTHKISISKIGQMERQIKNEFQPGVE